MKAIIVSLAVLFSVSVSQAAVYSLSGPMDVLQAGTNGGFGSGTGNGSGTIAGDYDDVTKLLNYSLTFQDLSGSVSPAHFHLGAPGVAGAPALTIPGPVTSPYSNSATLTAGQEADLLAGDWYVNLHTAAFGGGEIRGQVIVTPVPEPSSSMLLLGGVAAFLLRRRRG